MKIVHITESNRFVDKLDTIAKYCPEFQYFKFLYWKQFDLIVTASGHHVHENISRAAHRLGVLPEAIRPDGAGSVIRLRIESWESLGFDFVTEARLRPVILDGLQLTEA